jgi:F0F1-type ATP synthase epsilon subunit
MIIYEVISAINQADELRIQFPATPGERVKVAAGFLRLSSRQVAVFTTNATRWW